MKATKQRYTREEEERVAAVNTFYDVFKAWFSFLLFLASNPPNGFLIERHCYYEMLEMYVGKKS